MEYAVPSLALNYPCKEYQIIYESVHSYLCICTRNKYHARVNSLVSCFIKFYKILYNFTWENVIKIYKIL